MLRLRQDEAVKLTYKADASMASGIVSRFEAEVKVSDFETMRLILQRLGYGVELIYEKYRTTYALDGAEIVLDELPYGNFTEIEGDAETIERVVQVLGMGDARRMSGGYVQIFMDVKARLELAGGIVRLRRLRVWMWGIFWFSHRGAEGTEKGFLERPVWAPVGRPRLTTEGTERLVQSEL